MPTKKSFRSGAARRITLQIIRDFLSNLADTDSTRQDQLNSEQELPQKEEASQPKRASNPRKACGAMLAAAQCY